MATKKDTTPSKKKDKYRIRNWHEYNRSLVNRGSITFWTVDCCEAVYDLGGKPIIPPDKNAKEQKQGRPALKERDEAIRRIQELGDEGRSLWKKEIGYHRRSRVETLMFRYKTVLGDRLTSRKEQTQATEISIKLDVLNRMTEPGMPKSYKVAI